MINKILLILTLSLFYSSIALGQAENADFMRSVGKIYVVVAILLLIFLGIVLFLYRLERRIKKLEKK